MSDASAGVLPVRAGLGACPPRNRRAPRSRPRLRAAIEDDPVEPKNHYQLVQALAMLGQAHDAIARYRGCDDLISRRCLAQAYVADSRWPEAAATIESDRDDPFMLEQQAPDVLPYRSRGGGARNLAASTRR